ncbi:unnamed protein product [Timema podura]|uniref:Uncharacterized protein n=1 Tax=Timema podura TaxID=61482 RepID=A0ABN7NT19_TIMPD|nr:unnamed protein product [Timema podura]
MKIGLYIGAKDGKCDVMKTCDEVSLAAASMQRTATEVHHTITVAITREYWKSTKTISFFTMQVVPNLLHIVEPLTPMIFHISFPGDNLPYHTRSPGHRSVFVKALVIILTYEHIWSTADPTLVTHSTTKRYSI